MIKTRKSKWAGTKLAMLNSYDVLGANAETYLTDTGLDPREEYPETATMYLLDTGAVTPPLAKPPSVALATEIQDRQDRYDQVCNDLMYELQALVAHAYAIGGQDHAQTALSRETTAISLCGDVESILHAFAKRLC